MKILLYRVRFEKRLNLEEVSKLTEVSKSNLNNIENGRVSPTLHTLEKIAKGLDVKITDLFDSPYK